VKYLLRNAVVYQSPAGHLFTDHLDDEWSSPVVDPNALTDVLRRFIAEELSSDEARVARHLELVARHVGTSGRRVLDVGCGGGLLLARLRERGSEVEGTELNDSRVLFARGTHGLTVHKRLLDDEAFARERAGVYDAITMFDLIEHVNFPLRTLRAARALLRPGGKLLLETPCRDAALHRAGELGYELSRGRYPTLLDLMYSNHPYGHKQIFSQRELRELLERAGFVVEHLTLAHELSLPIESYLRKLVRSRRAAAALAPAARAFFTLFPIRNKLIAVARKG